jgi:hypothetical protein
MRVIHGPYSEQYRHACERYDEAVREYEWAARIVGLCIDKAQFARAPTDWTAQENLMLRVKETSRRIAILSALRGAVPPDTKADFGRYESSSGGGWLINLTFPPGADDLAGYRAARKAVDDVLRAGENASINVIVPAPGKVAPAADLVAAELADLRAEVARTEPAAAANDTVTLSSTSEPPTLADVRATVDKFRAIGGPFSAEPVPMLDIAAGTVSMEPNQHPKREPYVNPERMRAEALKVRFERRILGEIMARLPDTNRRVIHAGPPLTIALELRLGAAVDAGFRRRMFALGEAVRDLIGADVRVRVVPEAEFAYAMQCFDAPSNTLHEVSFKVPKAADEPTCPDCGPSEGAERGGRRATERGGDARCVFCPKWWAVRDPSADADCLLVRSADRAAPKVAPPPAVVPPVRTAPVWHPFTRYVDTNEYLPPERRCVVVQMDPDRDISSTPRITVGFLRYSGDSLGWPYFVTPGIEGTVTHWCDCLGDDFSPPGWNLPGTIGTPDGKKPNVGFGHPAKRPADPLAQLNADAATLPPESLAANNRAREALGVPTVAPKCTGYDLHTGCPTKADAAHYDRMAGRHWACCGSTACCIPGAAQVPLDAPRPATASGKPPMRTVDMFLNEIADCAVRLEQAHASVRNNVALYVDIGGAQFQFDGARMRSAGFAVVGVPNTPGSLLREKPAGVPAPPVRRTCLYGRCVTPPDFMVPDGKGGYTYVCTEHLKEAPNWPVAVLVSDGRPLWKGAATMEPVKCSHEACATMMEDRGAAAQLCPPCARWAKAEHGTNTCDGCAKVGHYETPEKQDDLEPVDADDEPDAEVVQCGPAAVALAERIVADHRRVEADEVKDAPAPVARLSPGELAAAQGFPRPPPETSQEFFGRMFPMPLRNAETFMLAVREAVPAATDVYMTTRSMTHEIRVTVPASATDVDLDGWRRRARFAIDHARPLGVNVEVSIERELPFAVLDAGHDRFLVVDAGREIAAVTGDEARVAVVRLLSGGAR